MIGNLKQLLRPTWRKLRSRVRLARYAWYDFTRFLRYSGAVHKGDPRAEAAQIIKYYHMIEKGLALPQPRPGFGSYAIVGLSALVSRRLKEGDKAPHLIEAVEVLTAYKDFNAANGGHTPACVPELLNLAQQFLPPCAPVATKRVERVTIAHAIDFDAWAFFSTRHSVRQFADQPIDRGKIEAAARMAQLAPSVCNRQAGRLHIVTDPTLRDQYLQFQNGNRGFGETMGALAIITVDLNAFVEPEERFQGWIDGGLFAMSFILGAHAQGIGTCCLNWSSPSANDNAFHNLSGIGGHESIIMMLAMGELRESFEVARSPRKLLADVLTFVD